jgi:hypothetical protein
MCLVQNISVTAKSYELTTELAAHCRPILCNFYFFLKPAAQYIDGCRTYKVSHRSKISNGGEKWDLQALWFGPSSTTNSSKFSSAASRHRGFWQLSGIQAGCRTKFNDYSIILSCP